MLNAIRKYRITKKCNTIYSVLLLTVMKVRFIVIEKLAFKRTKVIKKNISLSQAFFFDTKEVHEI